ncbi:MAG: hypothetical protein GXP26_00275 [Planctomycetes bacterium]|nr:hypothetical protein [Planctomycetota bacterium]
MSTNQQHDDWRDCPIGELSQMVGRLNAAQRQARMKQLYGKAAACVLLVAVGVFAVGTVLSSRYGGITCPECQEHFVAFYDHQTKATAMDDALASSMTKHLENCGSCRSAFEKSYPGVLPAELSDQLAVPIFAVANFATLY